MDNFKITITYKEKQYDFANGYEAYIFHHGILNNMDRKCVRKLLEYVSFVSDCYLKDNNKTPLGELCDFIANQWKTIKGMSRIEVLDKFYSYIGL